MSNNNNTIGMGNILYILLGISMAIIGYHIHGNIFWAIIDWLFWPIVLLKWAICHEINLTIIKGAFAFFMS